MGKIVLVGSGFKTGCFMWWDGNKEKGTWVVKAWPQYAVAVPKGNDHVWYRATFQLELNDGTFYSGYWEMDIHFRKGRVDLAKTFSTRQSSGPPLLGSRSPNHHHHHHLLPWPTSGEWEQKPRCCYSYFSFTSLQSGFYSHSSVVSNLKGSFTLKKCFAFVYHFCLTFLLFYYYTYFVLNCLPIICSANFYDLQRKKVFFENEIKNFKR